MRLAQQIVGSIVLLSVAAFSAAIVSPQSAHGAGAAPVTVTNTPLPIEGAVNANIINASIPVGGTVGVNSLPAISGTVAVTSLPQVTLSGTSAVSISNTSGTPVFADVDGPARRGVGANCSVGFPAVQAQVSCTLV